MFQSCHSDEKCDFCQNLRHVVAHHITCGEGQFQKQTALVK